MGLGGIPKRERERERERESLIEREKERELVYLTLDPKILYP